MSALAPTLQAFFTDRLDPPAQRQPAHDRRLPRHAQTAARRSPRSSSGREPSQLDISELDAHADRRVPRPPRARPRQQHPHPQRAARGDPLAVSIRRTTATPSTPRTSSACSRSRSSAQTVRSSRSSTPTRSRRCSTRPTAATWTGTTRPRAAADRDPDRAARLRADRPEHAATCSSAPARTSAAAGRDAKKRITPLTKTTDRGPARSGSPNEQANPSDPLFPTSQRTAASPATALERRLAKHIGDRRRALPSAEGEATSRRTRSGTPRRCDCCTPASTPP